MSEKMAKRVRRLEGRVDDLERFKAAWDAAEESVHNQAVLDSAAERNAERRRARQAERAVVAWRRMTYAVLVSAIIVLVAAILVVYARADCMDTIDPPVGVMAEETAVEDDVDPEEAENERIEAALLARAHVIEDCTVTFYCNERYPHICGTGDGIAADGTQALAWATCAVDPDVIPLGSTVLVDLGDGYGLRTLVANDTGVSGNHLDICVDSHNLALQMGRRTATVYWVAPEEVD